jgi:hypothetical protein
MRDDRPPEPAELHAQLSRAHPLDWGDLPTRQEITANYGVGPTDRALALLARAAHVEPRITADITSAIGDDAFAYHLKNRVKSPQSLARKLEQTRHFGPSHPPPEDVLRYSVGVDHPDQLVRAARRMVDEMTARGWSMESAHHSYHQGSRYKGLHFFLRGYGQVIEIQVHSRQSIAVKERTTEPYEIFRDDTRTRAEQEAAQDLCIEYSEPMTQPAGIDALKDLGGVPVEARSYGRRPAKSPRAADSGASRNQDRRRQSPHRRRDDDGRDQIDR